MIEIVIGRLIEPNYFGTLFQGDGFVIRSQLWKGTILVSSVFLFPPNLVLLNDQNSCVHVCCVSEILKQKVRFY